MSLPIRVPRVPRQNSELRLNQAFESILEDGFQCEDEGMPRLLRLLQALISNSLLSRRDLLLENLALRQQLAVLAAKRPRPHMAASDRMFWVLLQRFWSSWKRPLILIQPETVVRWLAGFRRYWRGARDKKISHLFRHRLRNKRG